MTDDGALLLYGQISVLLVQFPIPVDDDVLFSTTISFRTSLNAVPHADFMSSKIRVDIVRSVIPRVFQAEKNGSVFLRPVHDLVNA